MFSRYRRTGKAKGASETPQRWELHEAASALVLGGVGGDQRKHWGAQDLEAWRRYSVTVRFGPLRKGCPLSGAGISEGSYEVDSGRAWKKHAGRWKLLPPLVDGTVAWGHGWEQKQTRWDEHPSARRVEPSTRRQRREGSLEAGGQ